MSRVEDEVCKKIQTRSDVGKTKYGVTMETAPLSRLEWLIHAQEEAMDLAVYLQKLIEMEGELREYIESLKSGGGPHISRGIVRERLQYILGDES
jgi:hypothetical protein